MTLGAEARHYVVSELSNGLQLSQKLIAAQRIATGSVMTYIELSEGRQLVEGRSAEEMKWGGVTSRGYSLTCASKFIAEFLAAGEGRICVFENYNASPSSERLQGMHSHAVVHGQEVYNVVCGSQSDEQYIETAIRESESGWIFIGCMASIPNAESILKDLEIPERVLDEIAVGTEHVIVGAFDGEGYLIWSRRG